MNELIQLQGTVNILETITIIMVVGVAFAIAGLLAIMLLAESNKTVQMSLIVYALYGVATIVVACITTKTSEKLAEALYDYANKNEYIFYVDGTKIEDPSKIIMDNYDIEYNHEKKEVLFAPKNN